MKQMWMIVEDDPIIRSILTALMTLWGMDSLVFKDGHEAFQWLDQIERGESLRLPDIALMDIRVPGPQGTEIARRMRSIATTRSIPIVIMTAYQLTREDRDAIMKQARPDHIISKPLPAPDDLRTMLERTIQLARQKQAVRRVKLSGPQYRYLVDDVTSKRVALMQSAKRRRSNAMLDGKPGVSVPAGVRAAFAKTGTKPLNPTLG
jgi:CheY-like chemotaxis protein